jgi:hypothetical protein
MGAIVIRTRYDEGTESAEVATSARNGSQSYDLYSICICICRILGWYFTTQYSAQEVGCVFVILVAERDS